MNLSSISFFHFESKAEKHGISEMNIMVDFASELGYIGETLKHHKFGTGIVQENLRHI